MNDQVVFIISLRCSKCFAPAEPTADIISLGGNQILCNNLPELNKILNDLEDGFLSTIEENIFFKEVIKEEFISYQNSLGIIVKGEVKNYKIQNDLIEYIIRLHLLDNKKINAYKDLDFSKKENELILPFYTKKITVKKYLLADIDFEIIVSMQIYDKIDREV